MATTEINSNSNYYKAARLSAVNWGFPKTARMFAETLERINIRIQPKLERQTPISYCLVADLVRPNRAHLVQNCAHSQWKGVLDRSALSKPHTIHDSLIILCTFTYAVKSGRERKLLENGSWEYLQSGKIGSWTGYIVVGGEKEKNIHIRYQWPLIVIGCSLVLLFIRVWDYCSSAKWSMD